MRRFFQAAGKHLRFIVSLTIVLAGFFYSWKVVAAPVVSIQATKTVSGAFVVGGTVTYTVTISNDGTSAQGNNLGHEFTDTLPASLTLVSATSSSGTATTAGNTVNWDGSVAPLGVTVTISITATINAGTQGTTVSNQGTAFYDGDNNGTNESSAVTDDPSAAGASDPTNFTVGTTSISASKTVSGTTFAVGTTVTYTVVLSNSGSQAQPDNPGNEFTDVLPTGLILISASSSSGTATANVGTNTVTWNGAVPAPGSVTITIAATINSGTEGQTISNQGSYSYDSELNGTNESNGVTDDPSVGGASDPTTFVVAAPSQHGGSSSHKSSSSSTPTSSSTALCAGLSGSVTASGGIQNVSLNGQGGNTYCRVIAQDGAFLTSPAEVGVQSVLDLGVVQAVDVQAQVADGISVVTFMSPVQVCLRGSGDVLFLSAAKAVRTPQRLPAVQQGDLRCVSLTEAGTVVMVGSASMPDAPAAPTQASGNALTNCHVTTQAGSINLRAEPSMSAAVLAQLPFHLTLVATDHAAGWYHVIYQNQQGWVSESLLAADSACA